MDGEIPYLAESCIALFFSACLMFFFYSRFIVRADTLGRPAAHDRLALGCILISAFFVRALLSILIYGHPTDISCFMAWSNALANDGLKSFYTSGMFADYPPGYMYVLWLTGSIAKALRLTYGSAGYVLLTKMPAILADLGAAYLLYRLAAKPRASLEKAAGNGVLPLVLAAVVAFNPLFAFISGGWGQIDQVLTLLLLAVIFLFLNKKVILAGLVYGIAILVKPQALMAGPLLAVAYFAYGKDARLEGPFAHACSRRFSGSGAVRSFFAVPRRAGAALVFGKDPRYGDVVPIRERRGVQPVCAPWRELGECRSNDVPLLL